MLVNAPQPGDPIYTLCDLPTPAGAVVLVSAAEVAEAIEELAEKIRPFVDRDPNNPVVIVALLEGGCFYADRLTAELRKICNACFTRNDLKISTRDGEGRPLESAQIVGNVEPLRGRRILIVDDILDSGRTLEAVQRHLLDVAVELKSTVLIQKNDPNLVGATLSDRPAADFVGLTFEDSRWFSGAGMDMPGDFQGKVRNSSTIIAYPPMF